MADGLDVNESRGVSQWGVKTSSNLGSSRKGSSPFTRANSHVAEW